MICADELLSPCERWGCYWWPLPIILTLTYSSWYSFREAKQLERVQLVSTGLATATINSYRILEISILGSSNFGNLTVVLFKLSIKKLQWASIFQQHAFLFTAGISLLTQYFWHKFYHISEYITILIPLKAMPFPFFSVPILSTSLCIFIPYLILTCCRWHAKGKSNTIITV